MYGSGQTSKSVRISGRLSGFAILLLPCLALFFAACNNHPFGNFAPGKSLYTSMEENPATLDPARVTDIDSFYIASQIYDTPYEFHYLKRPLQMIPSMATALPERQRLLRNGRQYWTLAFELKPGLRFQDDPCFAGGVGRSVQIDDLIFAIKRAADDRLAPFGKALLQSRLLGFDQFSAELNRAAESGDPAAIIRAYAAPISGIERFGQRGIRLLFSDSPAEAIYFFANVSGAPVAEECVLYYDGQRRPPFARHPVGAGPFQLAEWRDQQYILLRRNENYRQDDLYPASGEPQDAQAGLLQHAGQRLPILDSVHIAIIKRGPPKWILFGQGYLDLYRNKLDLQERLLMTPQLLEQYRTRGVQRFDQVEFATFGWQYNLQHPLFQNNVALRRALSLLIDRNDLIRRFYYQRAQPAASILPPGMEGYRADHQNPWAQRNLEEAQRLLRQAGYPDGRDPGSGSALEIPYFDRAAQGRAPVYAYYAARFAEAGVRLRIEQLDFPSLIQKWNQRDFVMMHWAWGADYPDPQNFLQLFYSPNRSNTYNSTQYANPAYDRKYELVRALPPGPERERHIEAMLTMLENDMPVAVLIHRASHQYVQPWTAPVKPSPLEFREMKYWDLDAARRAALTDEWNRPGYSAWLSLSAIAGALLLLLWYSLHSFRRHAGK
ncbi:MAG: hypothetical protein K1X75_15740 [Leptospirales bacterium]|nr:hypothetical protein [Leptospirales bacterium]